MTVSARPERIGAQPNLKDQVAQQLRRMILSGELQAGGRIDQDALAESLEVSKLPLREALIVLQFEGLVEVIPRRGAYVSPLTEDDVLDHYEIFGIVSGIAAERAAQQLSQSELDELERIIDRMAEAENPDTLERLNFRFHRIINRGGSSHRLAAVLTQLSRTIPDGFFSFTTSWKEQADQDHRAILDALRKRNGKKASKLLAEHLHASGEFAVRLLAERGFWAGDSQATDQTGSSE